MSRRGTRSLTAHTVTAGARALAPPAGGAAPERASGCGATLALSSRAPAALMLRAWQPGPPLVFFREAVRKRGQGALATAGLPGEAHSPGQQPPPPRVLGRPEEPAGPVPPGNRPPAPTAGRATGLHFAQQCRFEELALYPRTSTFHSNLKNKNSDMQKNGKNGTVDTHILII